jgi:DNA invertase Pin-like site-specific DNA recombinase
LAHMVETIQELSALGVRFVAVTQNLDTDQSNPMLRLLLHIMGAFAEFERELIRERVLAGLTKARREGRTAAGCVWWSTATRLSRWPRR